MRLVGMIAFGLAFATPVVADIIPLEEGDVYCMSYDETTNTCASVQTLKALGDEEYMFLDLSGFAFGETNLSMTSTMKSKAIDGQLCLVPGEIRISITPKESKLAEGWQNLMQYQIDEMADQGYCFEHKRCDEGWVAIGYVDGEIRQDISATFRVFRADDKRSKTVQPRFINDQELREMQKKVSDKCFAKDT